MSVDAFWRDFIDKVRAAPAETEWIEFKLSYANPQRIGEYISAISNSASLNGQKAGYIIWGIDDKTHEIVGTNFRPRICKGKGNEDLEPWLLRGLNPAVDVKIVELGYDVGSVVVFQVTAARNQPVCFYSKAYIRIGSTTHSLSKFPEKERRIWHMDNTMLFENDVALPNLSSDDVLAKINYPAVFDLLKHPFPDNRAGILNFLENEGIIEQCDSAYAITNLGAVLFAKDFRMFPSLERKAVRVVYYKGNDRLQALKEDVSYEGYAVTFEALIDRIWDQLPANEVIKDALRVEEKMYPKLAIREIVANALIHQDFFIRGTGPLVEIFSCRMEITNPGKPLIEPIRFIDHPPQSRNEKLASLMRRMNICEERGSGIDRAIGEVEVYQLPAPEFQAENDFMRVTLFSHRTLSGMDRKDRVRACYQHCCLRYICHDYMTNTSLRKRLGIKDRNYSIASRIIKDTIDSALIKVSDPDNKSPRDRKYVPFWA
jgi:predicted HTH transcriptional regulator